MNPPDDRLDLAAGKPQHEEVHEEMDDSRVEELVGELAVQRRTALTLAKRAIDAVLDNDFETQLQLEIDHLLSARVRITEAGQSAGVKVSVNDMLIKACAMALMAQPDANASYTDRGIARHKSAHVSVAVAREQDKAMPLAGSWDGSVLLPPAHRTSTLFRCPSCSCRPAVEI